MLTDLAAGGRGISPARIGRCRTPRRDARRRATWRRRAATRARLSDSVSTRTADRQSRRPPSRRLLLTLAATIHLPHPTSRTGGRARLPTIADTQSVPKFSASVSRKLLTWLELPGTLLHTFNGPLSGTTRVSRYRKGKTNLDFTEASDSEWQWHQLGHMQVCTSLQTDNHASTPPLKFFTGRMPFLSPNQQRQSTEGLTCLEQQNYYEVHEGAVESQNYVGKRLTKKKCSKTFTEDGQTSNVSK